MAPVASALRLPRALVFATLCLVASGGGHALAGGGPVPPLLGALGGVIAFCLAYALNGRERGPGVVLPATAGTQALLHDLFTRAAPAPHPAPSPLHGHPGLGMTAVHLAVALLTGWWLQRGESALWLMIRLYGVRIPVVRLFVIAVTGLPGAAPRAVPASDVRPYDGWEASPVLRRRGPPAPARVG